MRISNKITCVFFIGLLFFAFAGCDHSTSSSSRSNSEEDSKIYIGTKVPSEAKEVGDIVFNDGSATPYTSGMSITDKQKKAAIALIFYKGTELNSGDDITTVRTLGVGLKHKSSGLAWCLDSANAHSKNIKNIQCKPQGPTGSLVFDDATANDRNGSDNLEQIADFLTAADGVDDDTTGDGAADRYPAFYFAKNYKDTANNLGSYSDGWYLPSTAELFQIYKNGKGTDKKFDIYAVNKALGVDMFKNAYWYWSSSQCPDSEAINYATIAYRIRSDGAWSTDKKSSNMDKRAGNTYYVCAIREF